MNMLEAIEYRKSRRSYINIPLNPEEVKIFKQIIEEINTESQLNFALEENASQAFNGLTKSYGMFSGVNSVFIFKGSKNDPNLKEKVGYYGEKLVLAASSLGLGTCWVGLSYDRSNSIFTTEANQEIVAVCPVGKVSSEKTIKEKFIHTLGHLQTKNMEDMYEGEQPLPENYRKGMEALFLAPSAVNRKKTRIIYKNSELRAYTPDEYKFDLVDFGIAKLHFELADGGKFELGNNALYHKA